MQGATGARVAYCAVRLAHAVEPFLEAARKVAWEAAEATRAAEEATAAAAAEQVCTRDCTMLVVMMAVKPSGWQATIIE